MQCSLHGSKEHVRCVCLQVRAPALKIVAAPEGAAPKPDPSRFTAPVKDAVPLLAAGAGGDRATTLVTLDSGELPFLQYAPGDHLVVYPENEAEVRGKSLAAC